VCSAGYSGASCAACASGYQDNDANGTCTVDCTTAALSCSGHGACSDSTGTARCACDPGYSSTDCAACDSASCARDVAQFSILAIGGTISGTSIALTVPYGTSRAALVPTIAITGASVSPASGVARDFTNPVVYTVTAQDGSTKAYTVTVTVALNPAKDITQFTILGLTGTIAGTSISLTVPYGTSRTSLTPTVVITGASVSPASGVARDFTNPVVYTVTAEDGSTKAYTVTVTVALNPAKDITQFTILGVNGTIGGTSISLTVPYGTSLTSLTPTIVITGASVSPASGVAANFSSPATYTVTAADGSTKAYTVTVTVAPPPNRTITFNANAGSGSMSPQTFAQGTTANLTANSFWRSGYSFAGWATSPSGGVAYNDQQSYTMGASNVTLYAVWAATGSLVAKYNFNNRNCNDLSGRNNHCTAYNVAWVSDGAGGYAASFNGGNSYMLLPYDILRTLPSFTIMVRFKAAYGQSGSLVGYQQTPVGGNPVQYIPIISVRTDGRLVGILWTNYGDITVLSSNRVDEGAWHTVYFSATPGSITLYLDGSPLGTSSGTVQSLSMSYSQIGTAVGSSRPYMVGPWFYFNGLIAEFYLYSAALY